ncbi:MAG TPA: ABC transporter ATP-binding protein [Candidatus Limiplasma sp.]|nr:ABC transporter ATP-binding protein [Candidatus Limiplasma sp.]HRX08741.1 ABC transporter ATP-binding protein [Candidatus Limiplasma sp.]
MSEYIIEMVGIRKVFPGVIANDNITLQLKKGEIHALLGENGAGKSTLMGVLFGMYQPEAGEIRKDGKPVRIHNPNDANNLGIGMVHQHFKLVEVFSVMDNIMLGAEDTHLGILQKNKVRDKVLRLSEKYKLKVDLDAVIEDISVGMQQRVEILKMLYRDNDILIFDEPTAVLTPQEIEELMQTMRNFANEGKSILFITHKLNEIMAVADRCTVLRKGKYIGTVDIKDASADSLAEMMVGRKVNFKVDKKPCNPKDTILRVNNLSLTTAASGKHKLHNVSFNVRAGEIVGIAGIEGNGQSELVYVLTGMLKPTSGTITFGEHDITKYSIRERNDMGIAHIPEDRHRYGLVLDYNLAENLILKSYYTSQFNQHGFLRFLEMETHAQKLIEGFDIRAGEGGDTPARSMSGGNQQKAIIAREVSLSPKLLIAVQPTRGLDVGAIEYIQKQLIAARDAGRAVLLVSLELEEIMNVSDRILVMYEGKIVAEVEGEHAVRQELGLYMAGATPNDMSQEVV